MKDLILSHLEINTRTEDYKHWFKIDYSDVYKPKLVIDYENLKSYQLDTINKNLSLIESRKRTRQAINKILVGDYILYKDGSFSRVTHDWGDSVQDGGGSSSFHMFKTGNASYSGGLNPGLKKSILKLTGNKKPALFWFFSEDWAGANRGINFYCEVNIWEVI